MDSVEELQEEYARLQLLVCDLLLTNQELRNQLSASQSGHLINNLALSSSFAGAEIDAPPIAFSAGGRGRG